MRTRNHIRNAFTWLMLLLPSLPAVSQSFLKVNQQFNDIAYSPVTDRIYAAYTASAPRGNSILVIDPLTGHAEDTIVVRAEPYLLRFSSNYEYLYISFYYWNGIARYKISTGEYEEITTFRKLIDIFGNKKIQLDGVNELMPVPGQPDAIAIAFSSISSIKIYDGPFARPDSTSSQMQLSSSLGYHSSSGNVYGFGNEYRKNGLVRYILSPSGISYDQTFDLLPGHRYEIEIEGDRLYSQHGEVIDISGATPVQTGNIYNSGRTYFSGVMEYDPLSNLIYNVDFRNTPFGYAFYKIKPDDLSLLSQKIIPDYGTLKPMKMISTGQAGALALLADPEGSNTFPLSGNLMLIHDCDETNIQNISIANAGAGTVCKGDSVTLTASGSYDQFIWTNGKTGAQIKFPLTATSTIAVSGYDQSGCRQGKSTPLTITVVDPPSLNGPKDIYYTICKSDTITLTAYSDDASYFIWSTGEQSPTIQVSQPGYYTMLGYHSPGCTDGIPQGRVVQWYTPEDIPPPVISPGGPFLLCAGDTVELSTHSDIYRYAWRHNANPFDHVFITKNGDYQVRFRDAYGCYGPYSDPVNVQFRTPPPTPVIKRKDSLLYVVTTYDLEWFLNGEQIATPVNDSLIATAYGFYSVRAISAEGCYSKFSAGLKMDTPVLPDPALLQGYVFVDYNANNMFDGTDIRLANQQIRILPSYYLTFTNESGYINFIVTEGQYHIQLDVDTTLWEVRIGKNGLDADVSATQVNSYIFSVVPKEIRRKFRVNLWSCPIRCSRETPVFLELRNKGNQVISGSYCFIPDEQIQAVTDSGVIQLPLPDTLCWRVDSLAPTLECKHTVYVLSPGSESVFDTLFLNAFLTLDSGETGAKEKSEILHCAYDPNDKAAYPRRGHNGNYALLKDTLEYTIRFQNTGNDTAFQVTLVDQLADDLDWSTFEPLSASHEYRVMLDLTTGKIEIVFDQIMLPDSNVNYAASQGFFSFSILPKSGLSDHTKINNEAEIYFDFNPAVTTNNVELELVNELPTKTNDIKDESIHVTVSPNPHMESFTVNVSGIEKKCTLEVFDLLGRRWYVNTLSREDQSVVINTLNWPPGIFEFQIRETGSHQLRANGLVVKE
ncbi:MAG TPA: hypothetical protein VFG10_07330 [Saprospiraceae bacterium]|nr:hypothetical protein [Saprospiraceae bacterium]